MGNIYSFNNYPPSSYQEMVKAHSIKPKFKLIWLYQDEQEKEDITSYIIVGSGSLNVSYGQGQRRSLNFMLNNTNGKFTPNERGLWLNTKFKLELGMENSNGDVVYNNAGIFVMSNPSATRQNSQRTIDVQCVDKFALLDGTLGGTTESTYEIPIGTNIKSIMSELLLLNNGNGFPIDNKEIVFDSMYSDAVTAYTLTKSADESYGAILISLADMIACDIWYGVEGNLIVRSGTRNISYVTKPTLWYFRDTEYEYVDSTISYDFTTVRNSVTVVGANSNGDNVYIGTAENTNATSPTRISLIGKRTEYIEDSNISTTDLAQQRADYELNKICVLQNTISLDVTYMIHLDVNNCIALSDSFYNYEDNRFVITTIEVPLSNEGKISIECSNLATLPYYDES